jgi:glycosyltransferase involved in cell wall biosynthesis
MRVVYFTKYSRQGASSRLRSYQYFSKLKEKGIQVDVSPLFDDDYLKKIYNKKTPILQVLTAYLKRLGFIFKSSRYNLVIIEYELLPYLPPIIERVFALLGIKYIVDYDDAIFHNYDKHPNKLIRRFLGNKIDIVMKYSSCLIAGNHYLADRAKKAGAKQIEIIPTVIDQRRYRQKKSFSSGILKIGWIGSPSTFKYLKSVISILEQFAQDKNVEIHIVGSIEKLRLKNAKEIYYKWHENTEVNTILNFDVGIMPLEDTLWAKGKCAYKLIQYMACGIPLIASSVGMNKQVIDHGKNGFLAETEDEWIDALNALYENPELQKRMGENGLKKIDETYNLGTQSEKLIGIMNELTKS